MNKYEKLKQIIQQANPEIMELKFGCVVTYEGSVGIPRIRHVATVLNKTQSGGIAVYTSFIQYFIPEELEILGRPITLSDVLLAIKAYKIKLDFDTRSQPFLFITDWNDKTVIWDLTKPFDDQSQEIKDFLVGLLVKE